ncbi:hypothetical protein [Peribacillus frigoritolerans]|uniref:hypothetical protein n=1 Tax=Peribacillus castrilensis TaxID=2897690 RepID=UPI002DCB9C3A|nr:hypothetical protein [Peribacillus castrilensis]
MTFAILENRQPPWALPVFPFKLMHMNHFAISTSGLILVAAPYTPHMKYFRLSKNGGRILSLTVFPSRRPQLISVYNDHE